MPAASAEFVFTVMGISCRIETVNLIFAKATDVAHVKNYPVTGGGEKMNYFNTIFSPGYKALFRMLQRSISVLR